VDTNKRKALENAGWTVGDAAHFLEMSADELQTLDSRVSVEMEIRQQRESPNLVQGTVSSAQDDPA